MTDRMTREQRHYCMSRIRSKDTKPEILVRHYLFARGFRYRKNVKRLPGTPDIVLRKYRTAIFVHGCFWHGHEGCRDFVIPKTRTDYWLQKIDRNRQRDCHKRLQLRAMGWHVIEIWACRLAPCYREETLKSLVQTLLGIYLHNHAPQTCSAPVPEVLHAAEEPAAYGK